MSFDQSQRDFPCNCKQKHIYISDYTPVSGLYHGKTCEHYFIKTSVYLPQLSANRRLSHNNEVTQKAPKKKF